MISAQIKFNKANHSTINAVGPDLTADKIAFSFGAPVWGSHKLNADLQSKYILLEGERRKSAQRRSLASISSDGPAGPSPTTKLEIWEVSVPAWHSAPIQCSSLHEVVRAIPDAQYWHSRRWSCYREVFGVFPVDLLDRRLAEAGEDRHQSVQASLFADSFADGFESWKIILRFVREYQVDCRAILNVVRELDKQRTEVLLSLWRAERPAALPPPPSTTVLERHHSYLFDFSVRHWPGAVVEPSAMRAVVLWRLPFSDVLRELPAAHLRRSLRLESCLRIFGALPVDMLERSMVQITRAWYSGQQATMFADQLADCNDSWRDTLARIRSRPIKQPDKKAFQAIEEAREHTLINYYQSLPALSGSYFPALPAVGRITHPTSGHSAARLVQQQQQQQRQPSQHHGSGSATLSSLGPSAARLVQQQQQRRQPPQHRGSGSAILSSRGPSTAPPVRQQQQRRQPSQHRGSGSAIFSSRGHSPPPPYGRFPGFYDSRLVGRFVPHWKPGCGPLASGLHRPTKPRRHRAGTSRSGRGPPDISLRGADPSILVAATRRCRPYRRAARQPALSRPVRVDVVLPAGRSKQVVWGHSWHVRCICCIYVRGSVCMLSCVYVYDGDLEPKASGYLGAAAAGLPAGRCGIG